MFSRALPIADSGEKGRPDDTLELWVHGALLSFEGSGLQSPFLTSERQSFLRPRSVRQTHIGTFDEV